MLVRGDDVLRLNFTQDHTVLLCVESGLRVTVALGNELVIFFLLQVCFQNTKLFIRIKKGTRFLDRVKIESNNSNIAEI